MEGIRPHFSNINYVLVELRIHYGILTHHQFSEFHKDFRFFAIDSLLKCNKTEKITKNISYEIFMIIFHDLVYKKKNHKKEKLRKIKKKLVLKFFF